MIKHTLRVAVTMMVFSGVLSGCISDRALEKTVTGSVSGASGAAQVAESRRIDIRMQLAIGYYEQRQFDIALQEVSQVVRLAPNYADAYSVRALIFMAQGEYQLAENNFLRAMKLSPGNPDYANNYGLLLCGSGREKQGIAYFDVALDSRVYRTPSVAATNAGACSLKLNDVAAAKAYFLRSLQFDPAGPLANVYMAKWYLDSRDVERARFHIGFVENNNALSAEVLWLAIKLERQLGNTAAEKSLVAQLRLRYPASSEYAAYQRGAFDE